MVRGWLGGTRALVGATLLTAAGLAPGCAARIGGGGGGGGRTGPAAVVVTSVTPPKAAAAGSSVKVDFTLENHGGVATAPGIDVDARMGQPGVDFTGTWPVGGLLVVTQPIPPGGRLTRSLTVDVPGNLPQATYALWIHAYMEEQPADPHHLGQARLPVTGASCPEDAYEPDDTPATATPLVLDTPQDHVLCQDPYDWFSFVATAGDSYAVHSGIPGDFNVPPKVYAPDGKTSAPVSSQTTLDYLVFTAATTGDYKLLQGADPGAFGTGSGYRIVIHRAGPDLAAVSPDGGGEDPLGTSDAHPGGLAWFDLEVDNRGIATQGPVDLGVYLSTDATIGPSDLRVATEHLGTLDGGAVDQLQLVDVPIPTSVAPGSYTLGLVVDPDDQVAEMDETDDVATVPLVVTATSGCTPDAYEDDDLSSAATPIKAGTVQSHTFCADPVDWLAFDATGSGTTYEVNTSTSGSMYIDTNLFAPDGTEIFQSSTIPQFTTTTAGTYLIELIGHGAGSYTVSVTPY